MSTTTTSESYLDADRGPPYRAYLIFLTVLVIAAISLRFWSRLLHTSASRHGYRLWWDDWVALASLPVILTQFAISFELIHLGWGHHMSTLSTETLYRILKLLFAIYYIYDVAIFLTKMSALLFFSRIFPKTTRPAWFTYILVATHILNVGWLIGIVVGTSVLCHPVAKNWYPALPGSCGSTSSLWIGSAAPSVAIDLIILLLPMPIIWGIKASRARRIGLVLTFGLGYCVIAVSLGRLATVLMSQEALNEDLTYAGMPMVYWVSTEAPTLLLGICLPAMLPLGRHVLSEYLSPMASYVTSALSSSHGGSRSELRSGSGDFGRGGGGSSSLDSTPLKEQLYHYHQRSAGSKSSASADQPRSGLYQHQHQHQHQQQQQLQTTTTTTSSSSSAPYYLTTDRLSVDSYEEMAGPTEPLALQQQQQQQQRPQLYEQHEQSPYHYTCSARVLSVPHGGDPAGMTMQVPPQAIWVENGITVLHQDRRV